MYLKGGSFIILFFYLGLIALYLLIKKETPNKVLLLLCITLPLLVISPMIKMFTVALGMIMLGGTSILIALLFGISLPVISYFKKKKLIKIVMFSVALFFFVWAHLISGYSKDRPNQNTLNYILDADKKTAFWSTSDANLDSWVKKNMGSEIKNIQEMAPNLFRGGYEYSFPKISKAPVKNIPSSRIEIKKDTIIANNRLLKINIKPQRNIENLTLFVNKDLIINKLTVNGRAISKDRFKYQRYRGLFSLDMIDDNLTEIELEVPKENNSIKLTIFEFSTDLIEHPLLAVLKRPKNTFPSANPLNNSVVTKKSYLINNQNQLKAEIKK